MLPFEGEGAEALMAAASVNELVGTITPFRLTHRQATGLDCAGQPQAFLAAAAVVSLPGSYLVCQLNRQVRAETLPRFRRFLESARPE